MSDKEIVTIKIDLNYIKGEDLAKQTKEAISGNLNEFLEYCERLVDNGDSRLEVTEIRLDDFDFNPDTLNGSIFFSFDTWMHTGCRDLSGEGEGEADRSFYFDVDINANKIIFEEFELPLAWQPDLAMEDY